MAVAAPGAGGNAGKDGVPRGVSRAELVKRWEDVFDDVGDDYKVMELFLTQLLRDARKEEDEEEHQRRARVFEPWQPPPPGSALPPPVATTAAVPRVERTVVLSLRAPPHLLPRNVERKPPPPSLLAADLGRSVKPGKKTRGGV